MERARADQRITGAAITGSASHGAADRWSDIDLFFGVAPGSARDEALAEWTRFVYGALGALHHFDLHAGPAVYRAFLLPGALEVDLAFTPASEFGPTGPHFELVFGEPVERPLPARVDRDHLIGLCWHHVLHARICIERGKRWQAEYWISSVRDHALSLACIRLGQTALHAKGVDALPDAVTAPFQAALVRSLDPPELGRALAAVTALLLGELRAADAELAARLEPLLLELASPSGIR